MSPYRSTQVRRSGRIHLRVPVTVSGSLSDGRPFSEDTLVSSISKYGAKFFSRLPLKVGMHVRVQPKKSAASALFRVAWTGRPGTARAGEVGIEYVTVSNLLGVTFPE